MKIERRKALNANIGVIGVGLDTYWDHQANETASFCLTQSSLYFACLANGNSRMYSGDVIKECVEAAGLSVSQEWDGLGNCHTLYRCSK